MGHVWYAWQTIWGQYHITPHPRYAQQSAQIIRLRRWNRVYSLSCAWKHGWYHSMSGSGLWLMMMLNLRWLAKHFSHAPCSLQDSSNSRIVYPYLHHAYWSNPPLIWGGVFQLGPENLRWLLSLSGVWLEIRNDAGPCMICQQCPTWSIHHTRLLQQWDSILIPTPCYLYHSITKERVCKKTKLGLKTCHAHNWPCLGCG